MPMKKSRPERPARTNKDQDALVVRKRQAAMDPNDLVDINNVEFLRRFVTEYGKIIPSRVTGVTALQQRHIKKGIRRARNMGLLA